MEDAYVLAEDRSKPIMVIVHSSECGACKHLRPKLIESDRVKELSNKFVMVNDIDGRDSLAEGIKLENGAYYPRYGSILKSRCLALTKSYDFSFRI